MNEGLEDAHYFQMSKYYWTVLGLCPSLISS